MAKLTPYVDLTDVQKKIDDYKKTVGNPAPVFDRTLKDLKSRAPGKVADAVRAIYSIKKTEITCKKNYSKTSAGKISARGDELAKFELRYEGRVLTPLHFGMTPKTRPDKKKYKVKAKIKKEKKQFTAPEGGGVFLAPASKSSSTVIAWMRETPARYDISAIKTLSLPQMVDNTDVREIIGVELGELLEKRFNHNLDRHLKKLGK